MMHFKDQKGEIFAFESDGSQDYLIQPGMVPLTELELDKLFNPTKYMSPEELKANRVLYLAPLSKSNFKKMIWKIGVLEEFEDLVKGSNMELQIDYSDNVWFFYNDALIQTVLMRLVDDMSLLDVWEATVNCQIPRIK